MSLHYFRSRTGTRLAVCWTAKLLGAIAGLLLAVTPAARAGGNAAASAPTPQYSQAPAAAGPLDAVRSWLGAGSSESELLPPDQAYQLSVSAKDADTLVARLSPAKDYYLYRDRIKFSIEDPPGLAVESVSLPPGDLKEDPTFGNTEVYRNAV
jgi:thiol:disulfide interchange protein DsbD